MVLDGAFGLSSVSWLAIIVVIILLILLLRRF